MAQRYGRLSALRSQIRKADFIQIIHQGVTKPSRGDFSVSNLYEFTGTLKDLTDETGGLSCVDYDYLSALQGDQECARSWIVSTSS